ncbi:MAG: DUF4230 domain-containing protein [Cyclobacteriaceae bacterium]|nr:DUF4230 domain-containing protein [Cyclobacteriaceae bacterium]
MISAKLILKIFPWLLLIIIVFTLYLTNHWPFSKKEKEYQHIVDTTVILNKIESLGKLELVKYNFKEVFEYKRLSDGKIIGNSILNSNNYNPDLSVILIASGEAVGCIDLTKIKVSDIEEKSDSIFVQLPAPELCYYKLDLENTKIYSFSRESWWSRLFSEEDEKNEVLQMAYQKAEAKLKEAAIESGIYQSTNENVVRMLMPLLEQITGKKVTLSTTLPLKKLAPGI